MSDDKIALPAYGTTILPAILETQQSTGNPGSPVVQERALDPQPERSDDTTSYLVKTLVAVVLGPKLSPYLVSWGIPLDPIMLSVVIGGFLHKAHQIIKAQTGWNWL